MAAKQANENMPEETKVDHDENAAGLTTAIAATLNDPDQRPNPWGQGHLKLYFFCFIIYFCSSMNGYDGSLMGSINVLPEYQKYYDINTNEGATTGLVFSIFQVGQMIGALFTWICDWQGRKWTVVISAALVVASAVFSGLAPTLPAFIAARFLVSFFATICTVAAPMLLVEIAPPMYRATVAGTYNTLYFMGSIIATFAVYGSDLHLEGNIKWRLPLLLQVLCPGIVALGGWWLPESPRWQIANGQDEKARAFIIEHHANGDADHPLVAIEMQEIMASLETIRERSAWACFDVRSLFKTRARLYRLMLAVTMAWFGQFSGNNIASYYLPIMLENVGIKSTSLVLLLNAVFAITGWIAATIGAHLHDVFGRRKMLMTSCFTMAVCLAIVAATAAQFEKTQSVSSSSASIAFIFIFGVCFAIAFTPMQHIYPAEVLANDMRANGMMAYQLTAGVASFVNTFAAPTAMKNIKYWFYVFFVFWDLFEGAFIYIFFVETKGRTLEELDAVFASKNPRKASTRSIVVHSPEL
ncbi:sugar transporter domain-containing protein [Sarocladium implicatum]|nr:sugar transporter domain-containing protein [Sarocladium implicatum]